MKKILVFSHNMELGGAEKSLLGLLENIDTSCFQVDLFLMRHKGELFSFIPKEINLLPEEPAYASLAVPVQEVIRKRQWKIAYGSWMGKRNARERIASLGSDRENDIGLQYSHLYTLPYMPVVGNGTYDAVISFLTPHYFAAQKVYAKKKIAWIHTDYESVDTEHDTQVMMWNQYDKIVSISEDVGKSFVSIFPEFEHKLVEIGNFTPYRYIAQMKEAFDAEEEMPNDGHIRLLSIGRFCHAKNFDNIPIICRKLCAGGLDVRWFIIGYGSDESLIRRRIMEESMEEHVIVLGKKENPYPYIKACDVYVQPSRYEGHCVSVAEAQMLNRPVIITNYKTAPSQIRNGVDGYIVSLDNDRCAQEMIELLRQKEQLTQTTVSDKINDMSNRKRIEQLYRVMEQS